MSCQQRFARKTLIGLCLIAAIYCWWHGNAEGMIGFIIAAEGYREALEGA